MIEIKPKLLPVQLEDGPTVYVRQMTGHDLNRWHTFRKDIAEDPAKQLEAVALLVALTVCREDGSRHYDPTADLGPVKDLPSVVLDQLTIVALDHNGLRTDAVEDQKKS